MLDKNSLPTLGATLTHDDNTQFVVWAPFARRVSLCVVAPRQMTIEMTPSEDGYYHVVAGEPLQNADYFYVLDGDRRRADPASRFQPHGVHGPSRVVDLAYNWQDHNWRGLPLSEYILYELHTGCFSSAGDFAGVERRLDDLADLGVTAIEIMPVAQFPGRRNWGYDGVFPFAAQNSYGGPRGLQQLVNAAHRRGLAVTLDVVYNHLGPEGNYLAEFGPYFTKQYHTPWGPAINFDQAESDHVRHFFIENALQWVRDFHFDALRLDAIQTIFDMSARPFLQELAEAVHAEASRLGRQAHVIGETNQNDVRQILPVEQNGLGLDAVWNDDFHHSLHAYVTGERQWVYQDHGSLHNFAQANRDGFVLSGQYSRHHRRRHGSSAKSEPAWRLVVFAQNHDQTGNRLYGERLSELASFEQLKLIAGVTLLAPAVPMLFMGEEHGEPAPFLYFVDHGDPHLLESVRRGRKRDCRPFVQSGRPVPDPGSEETFLKSCVNHDLAQQGKHGVLREFHKQLIALRKALPSIASVDRENLAVFEDETTQTLLLLRARGTCHTAVLCNFSAEPVARQWKLPAGAWHKRIDSAEQVWLGAGSALPERLDVGESAAPTMSPHSVAVFQRF